MNPATSSRKRHRLYFWLWCVLGIVLAAAAYSPQLETLKRNRQAEEALASARKAMADLRASAADPKANPEAQSKLLELAARSARECLTLLKAEKPEVAMAAEVELALVELESGHAFDALTDLTKLSDKDRPSADSPWTRNTPVIEAALAETRYKLALMCRKDGDGYENWSKYAETAARSYQVLAEHAASATEREVYLKNLAICTRLLHGEDDAAHSLGFPARHTVDCVIIARVWRRPPPEGDPDKKKDPKDPNDPNDPKGPWDPSPPAPTKDTKGR